MVPSMRKMRGLVSSVKQFGYTKLVNPQNLEVRPEEINSWFQKACERYSILTIPLTVWFAFFVFFQRLQPWIYANSCNFTPGGYNMLLVADPQLIDNHTYPTYPSPLLSLSEFTVDNYLFKNYWAMVRHLQPDSIVFLGDLLDNGRGCTDVYYEKQYKRFQKIFRIKETRVHGVDVHTDIPGNHDIGFGNGVLSHPVERFSTHFGKPNVLYEHGGHEIVSVDGISLSNEQNDDIYGPPTKFLEDLKTPEKPRILLGHVPLYRDPKKNTCGPRRESKDPFPTWAGYQYQTVIDPARTTRILQAVQPDIIFSGDDHDYCEIVHEYAVDKMQKHAIEINVKSISMAMGIWKPAVEILTLFDHPLEKPLKVNGQEVTDIKPTFDYKMCYLPPPYEDVVFYALYAAANFVYLCYHTMANRRTGTIAEQLYGIRSIQFKRLFDLCGVEFVAVMFLYSMVTI